QQADLSVRYYYEDRLGGTEAFVENFSDDLRGSDEIYGETIRTHRVEAVGSAHLAPRQGVKLDLAFNHHDQDSFYGDADYQARQTTAFAQLIAPVRFGSQHSTLFGAALRAQRYDDNTGATGVFDDDGNEIENAPDNRLIPGVFAQHEWVASDVVRLLGGLRLDYQEDVGVVPSPRASLKLTPGDNTTLRLNAGTGFRIVNLFTEDHAAYTGARATVILDDLAPERSVNGTVSLQHIVPFGANPLTIDVEGFYTYFTNKIEPNYDTPGQIVYANLDGSATTRGVSLTLSQSLTALPLTYTVGATVMDVFVDEDGETRPLEFAPDFQGVVNATYQLPRGVAVDYTMNLTGPMALPEYDAPFERPTTSPTFALHNLQVTKDVALPSGALGQVYLAVENVFDYTQAQPLVDPANPFGPNFDTAYVYGPVHGRCLGLGVRLTLP
ncbi:MAG: TonB-dependent receptor, partial [Bacteroidota bacterium]